MGGDPTFQSTALNLVPDVATKGILNVYLRDRTDGTIRLASGSRTGTSGGNGHSFGARVSLDGRYVVFESEASDLVWGDENGTGDVFLWDSIEERTVLISVNRGGATSGNGASWCPGLTPDGSRIAFVSAASDLIQGDTNGYHDVFVRDIEAGTTTLASVGPAIQTPYHDVPIGIARDLF